MHNGIQILVERKRAGVTQRELALELGVAEAVIIAVERGTWGATNEDRDRALTAIGRLSALRTPAECGAA